MGGANAALLPWATLGLRFAASRAFRFSRRCSFALFAVLLVHPLGWIFHLAYPIKIPIWRSAFRAGERLFRLCRVPSVSAPFALERWQLKAWHGLYIRQCTALAQVVGEMTPAQFLKSERQAFSVKLPVTAEL